jgi:CotH kinase protein
MAVVQLCHPTKGRAYYDRKVAAGKTPMGAMRCLKRRLSDVVFRQMRANATPRRPAREDTRGRLLAQARPAHAAVVRPDARCIRTTAAASDQVEMICDGDSALTVAGQLGERMSKTNEASQPARAKDEFFSADTYMFHVTGFPQQPGVLTSKVEARQGARLDIWPTDPTSNHHISGPDGKGAAFGAQGFSLINSGNRTLHAPKRSWKIGLTRDADHLAGMTCINLKSMYNDPSQMREALAWRLFRNAGVPAARHTYAKLAFDATYYGLFSVIEQVDKRFLKDHFGANHHGNLYKAYCGDVGCATLEHRAGADGDDSGRQYYRAGGDDDRTYRLKTNEDDRDASTYDDLAQFIATINGARIGGGEGRFDTDTFRESVDGIMNARAFLRWAAVNLLLGSWDNYYATPSNYYLYNSGRLGAENDFMGAPYFTFIPWDYDNCLGIDYFGTKWQYTDILDWPTNTRHYSRGHATSRIPLVQNLLRNHYYRQYYLDYIGFLIDTQFNPDAFSEQIAADSGDGLWGRVGQAAYLESATPYGQPFTGRQFTNDEVYLSGCKQNELRRGQEKADGIIHYVRMRRDSARQQLDQLRKETTSATGRPSFPATMEPLPPKM